MSPKGSQNGAQSGLRAPLGGEISPKNSSGGLLEVTDEFFRLPKPSKSDFEAS